MLLPKKTTTPEQAWDIQDTREGLPRAWVQWKATDVFMEAECACGAGFAIQGLHAYVIQCPNCGRLYATNGYIELIEVETSHAFVMGMPEEN